MSSSETPTVSELKQLYGRNVNIMGHLRKQGGGTENSRDAILVAYDLQAGSYITGLNDPAHRERLDRYTAEIAATIGPLGADSLLEAGVGEATTLCNVVRHLQRAPQHLGGFDISWSRVAYARKFCAEQGISQCELCTGDLFHIPFADDSFDVVYTAHSIEPNHGTEREAIAELYRVARKWLVLFEPSYELGNEATRARIEEHGYCRGLPDIARELGYEVVEHSLLENPTRDVNQTARIVIRKNAPDTSSESAARLACPTCRQPLVSHAGHWYCTECSLIYPVIGEVPCLLPENGILGSKFCEAT